MDSPTSPDRTERDGSRRLLAAIFSAEPVPCLCGRAHAHLDADDDGATGVEGDA